MSESSLNKGGHGAMYVNATRRDCRCRSTHVARCRYSNFIYFIYLTNITILKTWLGIVKSPTLPTPMRGGRKPGSKNTKPSSSQKPEVYNQHFPTLSDDEEKRLDQYIKAIREVRVNVDSHRSLNDCVRLVLSLHEFSPCTNLDRQYNQ